MNNTAKDFCAFLRSKTVQCDIDAIKTLQSDGGNLGRCDTLGEVRFFTCSEEEGKRGLLKTKVNTTVDVGLRFNCPDESYEGFPFLVRCEFDLTYYFDFVWTDEEISEFLNMNAVQDCWGLFKSIAAGEAAQCGFMVIVPYAADGELIKGKQDKPLEECLCDNCETKSCELRGKAKDHCPVENYTNFTALPKTKDCVEQ